MSICLRYHKNSTDAEEVLNMGFLKIVTKLDKYNSDVPFEAWIRRIMINTIIDDYRKNSKEKSIIQFKDIQNDGTENLWVEYNAADLEFEAEVVTENLYFENGLFSNCFFLILIF